MKELFTHMVVISHICLVSTIFQATYYAQSKLIGFIKY
jgi:hypothetical protein